jgi:excisionase family DNA binding protein
MESNRKPRKRDCLHPANRNAESGKRPENCLTLTVEEAAEALGISRAFAYEAVARGAIPCIRIGRRILVPRIALERMLNAPAGRSSVGGS